MNSGKERTATTTFLSLWKDLKARDRARLKAAAVAMLIGSIATAGVPILAGVFVDAVFAHGDAQQVGGAVVPLVALAGTLALISATDVVQHQLVHIVTTNFSSEMRQRLYGALMRWDLEEYVKRPSGAIQGRANRSIDGAEKLIKLGASELLPAVTVAIFAITFAIARYGVIGLVMAAVIPTGFALVRWQIRSQDGIRVRIIAAKEKLDGNVGSLFGLLAVIRTTAAEPFFDGRVAEESVILRDEELRHHIAMSKFDAAKTINETLWLLVTLVLALTLQTSISPGELTGVVLLYIAVTKPLRELHRVLDESAESALQADHLQADLAVAFDASYTRQTPAVGILASRRTPAIELSGVSFAYPAKPPVIRKLDLTVAKNERLGLVGPTGCGKSTVLALIARLSHDAIGHIRLHGRPLTSYDRSELSRTMTYFSQEPLLFGGTVRENLLMGRNGIADEEIAQACEQADILADILRMPESFETEIGQRGGRLSGGQRQRLCLARGLLRPAPILLLDEPTSALDTLTQTKVQSALNKLEDTTMIVVAHRLATLRNLDRIVVLDNGTVAEQGTYDDLVAAGGTFARMLANEEPEPPATELTGTGP